MKTALPRTLRREVEAMIRGSLRALGGFRMFFTALAEDIRTARRLHATGEGTFEMQKMGNILQVHEEMTRNCDTFSDKNTS